MSDISSLDSEPLIGKWKGGKRDQVEDYVKNTLWPYLRFTTDSNTMYGSGRLFVRVVVDLGLPADVDRDTWRLVETMVRKVLNNKRNNVVEAMKFAFKRT